MTQKRRGSTYLRTMRQDRELTLKELADLADLSMSYLSELERDTGKRPSPDVLHRLADALNLADKEKDEFFDSFGIATDALRAMVLIDGRWLGTWGSRMLSQALNETKFFEIDFDGLLDVVHDELGGGFEITRKFFFSSVPINLHSADQGIADSKLYRNELLHARLRERHHYDVVVVEADYRKEMRFRKEDREVGDREPPNPVPMALAAELLFNAAIPNAFDIAIVVAGDAVYRPALEAVRRLGKRVALVSIQPACDDRLHKGGTHMPVDWDVIWLDSEHVVNRVELKPERKRLTCASSYHVGRREVWTTELSPPGDRDYYCVDCRQKQEIQTDPTRKNELENLPAVDKQAQRLTGLVSRVGHKAFGFITVKDGQEFFFHATDLQGGLEFFALQRGDLVDFEPVVWPGDDPSRVHGRAKRVNRLSPRETVGPTN